MTYFIYKITNLVNGKIYIGKTDNIKKRWNAHKTAAINKIPGDYAYFHRAINKYGPDNFKSEIVEEFTSEQRALEAETKYIALFDSMNRDIGYNRTEGGDGASGYKFSEEDKQKMSAHKKVIFIGENNPFYGKTHTEETRTIISKLMKERQTNDKEKYDAMNIAQCDLQLEECLIIQHQFLDDKKTFEQLTELHDTNLHTIHHIIHGTYKAIEGYSLITEEQFQQIKKERHLLRTRSYLKFNEDQEKQIVQDHTNNMLLKDLCAKYGASSPTIKKVLKKYECNQK